MKNLDFVIQCQDNGYDCGAACSQGILRFHGINTGQRFLHNFGHIHECAFRKRRGWPVFAPTEGMGSEGLRAIAKYFGFGFYSKLGADLSDVVRLIDDNVPVLFCSTPRGESHYSVFIGHDGDSLRVADPGDEDGLYYWVHYADLLKYWYSPTRRYSQGISVFRKS